MTMNMTGGTRRSGITHVCWRCGRPKHVAANCVATMPEDVKRRILNGDHANVAIVEEASFTLHTNFLCQYSVPINDSPVANLVIGDTGWRGFLNDSDNEY